MSNFRDRLAESASSAGKGNSGNLTVINMQNKKNQGNLVFVPFNPADGSDSVAVMKDVMELMYHFKYTDKKDNNKEKTMDSWYRILNREDYGVLNPEELDEYKDIRSMGKKLSAHKFSKSQKENDEIRKKYIRFKDYTLLVGWVIEHRDKSDKLINQNVPALLIFSSKNFDNKFDEAMKAKDKKQGSSEWMIKLFNSNLERKKYMAISYWLSDNKKQIGYICNVSIEDFNDETTRYTGGDESKLDLSKHADKLKQMPTPITAFLGYSGRYFNAKINAKVRERLHELLNKYCGTDYILENGTKVEPVPTKDPLEGVEKPKEPEIPTDAEVKEGKVNDAWD